MDPLSLTMSIIALIEVTGSVTKYINEIRHASKEQARVAIEASNLLTLLTRLRYRVEEAKSDDPWFEQVKKLGQKDGPLDQYHRALERVVSKIRVATNTATRIVNAVKWNFDKDEVAETMQQIGRLQNLVKFALDEDMFQLARAIQGDVKSIVNDMESVRGHIDQALQKQLVDWLRVPDPSSNFNSACKKRTPGSGAWLLNDPIYQELNDDKCTSIWLHGIAGCGKTILSSTIIDDLLQRSQNATLAYFYFDFNDADKTKYGQLIRSLLMQLCSQHSDSFEALHQLYQDCQNGKSQPRESSILSQLKQCAERISPLYIVVDALDECNDREELLPFLEELLGISKGQVCVVLTSRPEPDIQEQIGPIITHNMDIQSATIDGDIRLYVRDRLKNDVKLKKWPKNIQSDIEDNIMQKANGMFRWAFCQIESIRRCLKPQALKKVLTSLPKNLDETYERMFSRIEEDGYLDDALRVLQWLSYSTRPLRLNELIDVIATDTTADDEEQFSADNRLFDPMDLAKICSGFVTIGNISNGLTRRISDEYSVYRDEKGGMARSAVLADTGSMQVSLAHLSVQEYLLSENCRHHAFFEGQGGHLEIATTSLRYLGHMASLGELTQPTVQEHPLAAYAGINWPYHLNQAIADPPHPLIDAAIALLECESNAWLCFCPRDTNYKAFDMILDLELKTDPTVPALYHASRLGVLPVVKGLAARGDPVDAIGGFHHTALVAATFASHSAVVQFLLKQGADTGLWNRARKEQLASSALVAAIYQDSAELVRMLLDAGSVERLEVSELRRSFTNFRYGSNETNSTLGPLIASVLDNGTQGAEVLHGALCAAAAQGAADRLRAILDHVVQRNFLIDAELLHELLDAACDHGHASIVSVLQDFGLDLSEYKGWALGKAARKGYLDLVTLLLERGMDVRTSHQLETPLETAIGSITDATIVEKDRIAAIELLIDRGSDVNARRFPTDAPVLSWAVAYDTPEVVQILLDHGAEVNATVKDGQTALSRAIDRMSTDLVRVVLDAGAASTAPTLPQAAVDTLNDTVRKMFTWQWATSSTRALGDRPQLVDLLVDRGFPLPEPEYSEYQKKRADGTSTPEITEDDWNDYLSTLL